MVYPIHLRITFSVLVVLMLLACVSPLQASLNFDLGYQFGGDGTMYGSGPWLNITFLDVSPGQVDMTISAVGLVDDEKVKDVYLNLDPTLNPTLLGFSAPSKTGDFEDPVISTGFNSFQANGDGLYDILIGFNTDGPNKAFNGGEAVKYTITLASLTANSFDFVCVPDGGEGEYQTAVHILDPGGVSGTSVWATTPEPATLFLLAAGAVAAVRRRNR